MAGGDRAGLDRADQLEEFVGFDDAVLVLIDLADQNSKFRFGNFALRKLKKGRDDFILQKLLLLENIV